MTGSLNRLSITLDTNGMLRDLTEYLKFYLEMEVENLAQTLNGMDYSFAKGTFRKMLVEDGNSFIKYRVGSSHWYAFIIEYGRGSMMSINNPFLGEYLSSGMYNQYRVHGDIRSWGRGEYTIPDWEGGSGLITREGRGARGILLENDDDPRFRPLPPSLFLTDAMEKTKSTLQKRLNDMFRQFPFSDYLKGGG